MAPTNAEGDCFDADNKEIERATPIDLGAQWFSSANEYDLARGLLDPRDDRDPTPSLKVNTESDYKWDGNMTAACAFSSRNPFRRPNPMNLSSDLISDKAPSPLRSPPSARQIRIEELEIQQLELELEQRKLASKRSKLQLEEFEDQQRHRLAAESQVRKSRDRDLEQQLMLEAQRKEGERLRLQKETQVDIQTVRQEPERVEFEKLSQSIFDAGEDEMETKEQLRRWVEDRESERAGTARWEQQRETERHEVERKQGEINNGSSDFEEEKHQILEVETLEASTLRQKAVNTIAQETETQDLERMNSEMKVVSLKPVRNWAEIHQLEAFGGKAEENMPTNPHLYPKIDTDDMIAGNDSMTLRNETERSPQISVEVPVQGTNNQIQEDLASSKILMQQRGNAAQHRRKSSNYSTRAGKENFDVIRLADSAHVSAREDDSTISSKELFPAPSSPPGSLEVSRHNSLTSQNDSLGSSKTDDELAWEGIKAAMRDHMPRDDTTTSLTHSSSAATSELLSQSDIPYKRPPVPPKDPELLLGLITQTQIPGPANKTPPEEHTVSTSSSRPGRLTLLASPQPPYAKKGRPSSILFDKFDSDTNADPVDEDLCFCGKARPSLGDCYFCWPCDGTIFCKHCWDECPPHQKNRRRRLDHNGAGWPHEKTEPAVAKKIFDTLQSSRDHDEQAFLHVQDENTSWFGAGRDEDDDVVFQDFGRYASLMAEKSAHSRQVRYPSLVSFVGQTGAGKSSLIRLLIELYAPDGAKIQVPVVGSNLHQDVPTSGDVHLYADPKTFHDEYPILHADCEGLDGGEREPMGAKARHKRDAKDKRTRSFVKHIRKQHHTSEREIMWAKTDKTRSREYHVRHLYPRLLFTFSDVIVFVMKNPRVIENAIEQLIRWAEAALETSSNQPVLPHAIIVLNASDNASDPELWDVGNATKNLMDSVRRAVHLNHSMRKYAEEWRQRGRTVETVEMLLLSYYSTVRVVRVPERGRPNLINEQLQKLYLEISSACVRARKSKEDVHMLLNSDELQPYLQYAFDHFSRTLEMPFDFVQASFSNNPIPANFGGNILKLAINIMEVWKDHIDGPHIFKELSSMVASCIMLDSARHRILGLAEKVFPGYMAFCDTALDEFCTRHWPCEYVHPNTRGRCVNVKAGHQSKGHQLVSGKVLAVGSYTSVFTVEKHRDIFRYQVYKNLENLLSKLQAATMAAIHTELERAAEIHKDVVLQNFYRHLSGSKAFISHTSCFSCLIAPPEHALPCGHVLCTPCVQAYGVARGSYMIDMAYCPLHHDDADGQFRPRWPVSIKPSHAGVRVLSLDGGGVRGIVELMIMQEIERSLGPGLPIQAFFDLIVGTSTGGIIALGLGANGWTVQKCISHFESLCREAFTRRGLAIPGIEWIAANFSRYETKPIEQVLKLVFGEHNLFAGPKVDMDDPRVTQRLTKVAVTTTTTAGTAAVLANYNRMEAEEKPPYQFHRSEKPSVEIKTWQAARATSAAPTMFKPFAHDPSGQVYQDGAFHYNCPIEVAMRERRLLWPDVAAVHPDIVLSLGTGFNPKSKPRKKGGAKISKFGLFAPTWSIAKVAIERVENTLDSEQTWRNFILHNPPPDNVQGRFVRLNLQLDKDPPKMDDVRALEELKAKTMSQFTARRKDIKNLADRLIATSFFFVQDRQAPFEMHFDDSITFAGFIMCRFSARSEEIQSLGESLRMRLKAAYGLKYTLHNPYFVVRERGKHQNSKQVVLHAEIVDRMIKSGEFLLDRVDVHLSDSTSETEILFCVDDQSPTSQPIFYPISGVPRCLMEDSTRGNRPKLQTAPFNKPASFDADWAAFEAKRAMWTLSSEFTSTVKDPFEEYGSPAYTTPGNVTRDTISEISQRYSNMPGSATTADVTVSRFGTPMPRNTGYYETPEDIGSSLPLTQDNAVTQDVDENLSDALLDPESERVRQQMLYLLLGSKGRPPPPTLVQSFPPRAQVAGVGESAPLYIPTIGFENRATRQQNIPDFVSASDQYRLGFSARTKHTPGVFELDAPFMRSPKVRASDAMKDADNLFPRRSVSEERAPTGTAF